MKPFSASALSVPIVVDHNSHGLRNEVALVVNRLLNYCPSPQARGFPAERWDSLRDALLEKDGLT